MHSSFAVHWNIETSFVYSFTVRGNDIEDRSMFTVAQNSNKSPPVILGRHNASVVDDSHVAENDDH